MPEFREIEIIGSLMPQHLPPGTRIGNGNAVVERSVSAEEVLAQIADAERAGVRTLLLVIESLGGDANAGLEVYAAIRRFARSGGRTIAFVQGYCASTAPLVVAACDFVLMRADGKLALHASHGDPDACARADEAWAWLLHERTGMPLEKLRGYMADVDVCCVMHDLSAQRLGWCDWTPCTIGQARFLAQNFALGWVTPETPRTRRLAGLASPSTSVAPELVAGAVGHNTQSSESTDLSTALALLRNPTVRRHATVALNWTPRTIPAGTYNSVARGSSVFVAVGNSSKCATSVDGIVWVARSIVAGSWNAVAWSPTLGLFCAVGSSICATSPDGVTWTPRSIPVGSNSALTWSADLGLFVTAGGGSFHTSPDGINWTSRNNPNAGNYLAITQITSAAYGGVNGALLCAVGSYAYATSADGLTWTPRSMPGGVYQGIAWNGITAVAVGSSEECASSTDGVTWVAQTVPTVPGGTRHLRAIVWTGQVFVATEYTSGVTNAAAYVSADGTLWAWANAEGMPTSDYGWPALAMGNSVIVAVGVNGAATSMVP